MDTKDAGPRALEYLQYHISMLQAFRATEAGLTEHGRVALEALSLMLAEVFQMQWSTSERRFVLLEGV